MVHQGSIRRLPDPHRLSQPECEIAYGNATQRQRWEKVYEVIDGPLREFIQRQQVFFVATAPMSQEGFINLSPKPLYEFQGQRSQLTDWAERKGIEKLVDYQRQENARSIDDLPGLDFT